MSCSERIRRTIGAAYKKRGVYIRSLDRLNRLPLHTAYLQAFAGAPAHPTREVMWNALAADCDGTIDYLEFGVHEGHSILHWAARRPEPESRFFGFDTFTGLPETWNAAHPEGHFDTGGRPPHTNDPRVRFIAGLFQDTLPGFLATFAPGRDRRLVVHVDCDLYSSALYCLTKLDPILSRGTLVIFDEFGDVLHEFLAFTDYLTSYRRQARLVCTHDDGYTAVVELD